MNDSFRQYASVVGAVLTALKVSDVTQLSWNQIIAFVVIVTILANVTDAVWNGIGRWWQRRRLRQHF